MTAPEIQQGIERTGDHLGGTVEELAARADVTARARARVAGMKDKATRIKVRAQGKATEMSGQSRLAQSRLTQGRLTQGQLAQGQLAQGQLALGDRVRRRWPLAAAAAGAVLVGSVLVRRRRKR
jgi:hypothetical protein